jgi:hypothetical protein
MFFLIIKETIRTMSQLVWVVAFLLAILIYQKNKSFLKIYVSNILILNGENALDKQIANRIGRKRK